MSAYLSAVNTPLLIPGWAWVGFILFICMMLALDLGVFSRKEEAPTFKKAIAWCTVWISLAIVFSFLLSFWHGSETAELFVGGYILELALSVDNLFIFVLVFAHFKIPTQYQHRVLFWGILGAIVMRALFIIIGVAAVDRFVILLPLFGLFLVFTGLKLVFAKDEEEGKGVSEGFIVRMIRKVVPLTPDLHGKSFYAKQNGRRYFTPLFVVLIIIECTDLIFAIDSIPAVLGILPPEMSVEERRFIAFTSNIFAIMGLRSMYFAISGFMEYFRFLKPALAFILVFIGIKMILPWAATLSMAEGMVTSWMPASFITDGKIHIPTQISLMVISVALITGVVASILFPKRK
jgi:tellurite resistance protein TerC